MNKMRQKVSTWYRLGFKNIATVASYRILKRLGYYRHKLPVSALPNESLFSENIAEKSEKSNVDYFSFHSIEVSSPPNWFLNPWNKAEHSNTSTHWSDISDFMPELGDIKLVWELSRFDWMPKVAWAYQQGDNSALPLLELWVRDWVNKNPVNGGLNWKCGQEASLRCLNLLVSALFIDDSFNKPSIGLLSFLEAHATRITPTLRYAMAQDNNHGTSEAAALFIVGEYLNIHGSVKQKALGRKWAKKGRYWLENRVKHLVMADGSFSQHSVTYHRLLLDSLSFVELVRDSLDVKKFSKNYYSKMKQAVLWLYNITDKTSGGAPNLGANDGAYLFNLNKAEYRDFRPSIQLGSVVFLKMRQSNENIQHPLLTIFKTSINNLPLLPEKRSIDLLNNGGYGFLRKDHGFAMMRLPIFKFRPSHADAHHIDIWHNGINIIRDGGTYSYNTDNKLLQYFSGTESHNTIQFDNRDQMPRLGRFLFGNWLKPNELSLDENTMCINSSYTDSQNNYHQRSLSKTISGWKIIDTFKGFTSHAVLRWRLPPNNNWLLKENKLQGKHFSIEIKSTLKLSLKLLETEESLYYMHKKNIPVLETLCKEYGVIETVITVN